MLARSVGAEIRHGTHVAIRIIHDPARRMKRAPVRTLLRLALVAGLLVSATGCTTLQTPTQPWTTAHEFYENPYRYSRDTIIEATVAELLSNENLFDGRRIGLTGIAIYEGHGEDGYWGFQLRDRSAIGIRCYEENYQGESWVLVRKLIAVAAEKQGLVRAVGQFRRGKGLELDYIEYSSLRRDTDHLPDRKPRWMPF